MIVDESREVWQDRSVCRSVASAYRAGNKKCCVCVHCFYFRDVLNMNVTVKPITMLLSNIVTDKIFIVKKNNSMLSFALFERIVDFIIRVQMNIFKTSFNFQFVNPNISFPNKKSHNPLRNS